MDLNTMERFTPRSIWNRHLPTAVVASTLLLTGCSGGFSRPPTPTPIPLPMPSTGSAQSSTYQVERGSLTAAISYSGKVALAVEDDIFFRRAGRVTKVHVKDGEFVEAGTLIAELTTDVLEIDLQLAENALEIANLQLAEAEERITLDQRNSLIDLEIAQIRLDAAKKGAEQSDEGTSSQVDILERTLEKAEISVAQTRTEVSPVQMLNVARAELNLERARLGLLDARATAPFSGQVRFITLREDDIQVGINAYEPVARIVDPKSLTIELNLTREQMNDLQEGMPVEVAGLSRNGQISLPGTIAPPTPSC